MYRLMTEKLIAWRQKENRKPLILKGARQVGKTWLMKDFGRRFYENTAYISFYNNRAASALFEADYDAARIIEGISALLRMKIRPGKTLIVFDEVQQAPRVIEALKYFCEDAPDYHIIASGSLLGVAAHEGISYPVGKAEELTLRPMNFKEFLLALGEDGLAGFLSDFENPLVSELSEKYEQLLKQYLAVGGMPEAVDTFVKTGDLSAVREVQLAIVSQYEGDFGKHIEARQLPRIRMTWQAIPVQLAKENRKFFFGQVKKGARMSDFEIAIEWLVNAGLVYKVNLVSKPAHPLKAYADFSAFKLYVVDVGLLGALSELAPEIILNGNRVYEEFKGAVAEQYVLQELIATEKYVPYYYSGEKSTYEVDFLIQKGADIVPVEVKAEDNLRAKSLKVYCEKYRPELAVRTSAARMRRQDWMVNVPLWAIASI